jgi:hypothetical protein
MEIALCHASGFLTFDVAQRFLQNLCNFVLVQ